MSTADTHEDMLTSLEILAQERTTAISRTRELRRREEARHLRILDEITELHRNANRALVSAIETAHERGIRKSTIYQRVGISSQRLGQIKRAIRDGDRSRHTGSTPSSA